MANIFATHGIEAAYTYAAKWETEAATPMLDMIRAFIDAAGDRPDMQGLLADVEGQVTEALEPRYFERWGRHYLLSLARSHMMQQCSNFKDPGLQVYGGEIFKALQERADDIFVALPPPVATSPVATRGMGGTRVAAAAPVNMARYYNAQGGCFAPDCSITLADGTAVRADAVRAGTALRSHDGTTATVRCVVRTATAAAGEELVTLPGGAKLTPYHPVVTTNGSWRFPRDLGATMLDKDAQFVYNFVLDTGHTVWLDGNVEACTLGHGFQGHVIAHTYLGSMDRVVADLSKIEGWSNGLVDLTPDSFLRSPATGRIISIQSPQAVKSSSVQSEPEVVLATISCKA